MRWKVAALGIVLTILSGFIVDHRAHAEAVVSIDLFYQELSPHGGWSPHPEFGYVWQPYNVGPQWKPYTDGRWEWSDQGWLWISYEPWGWATYHYGRWVYDDYAGWVWIPGTTWAPAWVSWHESPEYIGWSPLPPDRGFFVEIGFVFNSYKPYYKPYRYKHRHKKRRYYHDYYDRPHYYKPPAKHCVFLPYHKFGDHKHVASEVVPPKYAIDLRNTKHITNIKRANNKVYNYGPSKYVVEKRSNRKLVRHKIEDKYSVQLRKNNNINHVKGKSYKVYRPKIDRTSKNPFITNRNSDYKHNGSKQHSRKYKHYNQASNPKSYNTQTRSLKSSQTTRSYEESQKKGFRTKSSQHEKYGYKTRKQNTYKTNTPNKNIYNMKSNKTRGKGLKAVKGNTQKPIRYSKPKKSDSYKYKNKAKSKSYSNSRKPYSIKNRSSQQRSFNSRSNIPTSQRNRFSKH